MTMMKSKSSRSTEVAITRFDCISGNLLTLLRRKKSRNRSPIYIRKDKKGSMSKTDIMMMVCQRKMTMSTFNQSISIKNQMKGIVSGLSKTRMEFKMKSPQQTTPSSKPREKVGVIVPSRKLP